MGALFTALYDDGAEVLISGHAHNYERFAPQTPSGGVDGARGVVQIVSGAGGKNHLSFDLTPVNSVARNDTAFGLLFMTLRPDGYDLRFKSIDGSYSDAGSRACH
jgi:hypothetical protein